MKRRRSLLLLFLGGGAAFLLVGIAFCVRWLPRGQVSDRSRTEASPRDASHSEGDRSQNRSTSHRDESVEEPLPSAVLIDRFHQALEKRQWREVLRMKRLCAAMSSDALRAFLKELERDGRTFLFARLLETAYLSTSDDSLRREISEVVMRGLAGVSVDTLEGVARSDYLHFMGLYGGVSGAEKLLALLRDDSRGDVKRDAGLALGAFATEELVPRLKSEACRPTVDLSGIYAILALERMRKRGVVSVPEEERTQWILLLEQTVVGNEDSSCVGEALNVLAGIRDQETTRILGDFLLREDASDAMVRKSLGLLGECGTGEDLDRLDSFPRKAEFLEDVEKARQQILSRRPRRDDRPEE